MSYSFRNRFVSFNWNVKEEQYNSDQMVQANRVTLHTYQRDIL